MIWIIFFEGHPLNVDSLQFLFSIFYRCVSNSLRITHRSRLLWKCASIFKIELAQFYFFVALDIKNLITLQHLFLSSVLKRLLEKLSSIFVWELLTFGSLWVKHYRLIMHMHCGLGSIWIQTGPTPCTGLSDARQVPPRPYSMSARFLLWWRGQTFYSTRPIKGLFYLPH